MAMRSSDDHKRKALYSDDNRKEWKSKECEGLREFMHEKFVCEWNGFSVWDAGNGTVDCHYEAEMITDINRNSEITGSGQDAILKEKL